ncbi:hypothetical protein D3C76_714900 [compost metagenome]
MAQAPDLRQGPRRLDEGIVGGHPAIPVQAHRLAEVVVQRLGPLPLAVAIAEGDEEIAILGQYQAGAEVGAAGHLGLLAKQQLPVDEGVLLQPGPGHGGAGSAVPRLAVAEIEPALVVQGEIEQAPLTRGGDGGQTRDDMALAAGVDAQQAARALANQIAAFRQQDQPPGMVEPLHQGGQCQRPERAHQADQQQCKQSQQGGSPLGKGAGRRRNVAEV